LGLLALCALAGCDDGLGPCDQEAAEELVYGRGGLVATKGQALTHESCGNGAFCHAQAATGPARYGAPHGMSFDMLPEASGWAELTSHAEAAWTLVRDGAMPPAGVGDRLQGDGDFRFGLSAASEPLPPLSSHEGKAAFRNWLACEAPLVTATQVPLWAIPPGDDEDAGTDGLSFDQVYEQVLGPSCALAGCHLGASAQSAGEFDLEDPCEAHLALLGAGPCEEPRVVPGDGNSLLLDKVSEAEPRCKSRMPPSGALAPSQIELLRAWVLAGAPGPACP
jgi:hypothetical protein